MRVRTSPIVLALLASLSLTPATHAQRIKAPTLEQILKQLEENLNHYDKLVPSFFCDEHATSQVEPGTLHQNITTDSIFRLKRTKHSDQTTTLEESRDIKRVDGKPATSQAIAGPALVNGAFEGGLAVVSVSQAICMNYSLQRPNKSRPTEPYIIRFATVLTLEDTGDCLLQENSKGRAFVDPVSMQITHLELTTPRHTIIPRDRYIDPVVGKRTLVVEYAPVLLNNETYWMPDTITSRSTSDAGTFHQVVWSFHATYRNYHKLEVSSHILSPDERPKP